MTAFILILIYQILCPLIAATITTVLLRNFDNDSYKFDRNIVNTKSEKGWKKRRNMYIAVALSTSFCFYAVCLDIAALSYKLVPAYKEWYIFENGLPDILRTLPIIYLITDSISIFVFCIMLCKCMNATISPWYCIVSPIAILSGHMDQIIIGFTHNVYHASAVGVLYGILLVTAVAYLRVISDSFYSPTYEASDETNEVEDIAERIMCPCCFCTCLLSFFVIFGGIVAMFILLPINLALDEAPNRLITFYQTTVVAFAAYISYWLLIKGPVSPLEFLIKVKDNRLPKKWKDVGAKWKHLSPEDKEWAKKTNEEKEEEIAKDLEMIMLLTLKSHGKATRRPPRRGALELTENAQQ